MQKIKSNIFINLLTLFISSFICLWLIEILLNKHFDKRTIEEFIFDQKNNNILSFPVISPDLHIYNDGIDSTYPLSGLSSVNTVFCKTNSDWVTYFSDSYGFNNKNENLQKIEALLIGDSFTQGVCVDSNSNISSHLSNLGYNTINLGFLGNGPLIELGTLVEYAKHYNPENIFWFYCESNDLDELSNELQSNILRKYLFEENFFQNLINKQPFLDDIMYEYLEKNFRTNNVGKIRLKNNKLFQIFKLTALRYKIKLSIKMFKYSFFKSDNSNEYLNIIKIFKDVLKKAKKETEELGANFYFVYLPDYDRYILNDNQFAFKSMEYRNDVLRTVSDLNIPIIDLHKTGFQNHTDPLSLFPERTRGHYNSEGYKLVAKAIHERLR